MEEIKPDSNVIIIEQNNGLKILHQCRVNTATAIMRTPKLVMMYYLITHIQLNEEFLITIKID